MNVQGVEQTHDSIGPAALQDEIERLEPFPLLGGVELVEVFGGCMSHG
jgi:hypothetical protein